MRYTKKFKEDIVTRYSKGESVHELSLSTGASVSTIYTVGLKLPLVLFR